MSKITVINYHLEDVENSINIMRPSIFGNPFKVGTGDGEYSREEAVLKYYHYLREEYGKKGEIFTEMNKLADRFNNGEDLTFKCCCKPKLCHGDVLKTAVLKIALSKRKKENEQVG